MTATMTDRDEELQTQLARRNWFFLAALTLGSVAWRSFPISLGVATGGLLAITAFSWMHRSLGRVLKAPSRNSAWGFQVSYFIRLAAVGAAIFLLIAVVKVHPVALAAGLSVVVVNIFWTTLRRLF